MVARKPITIGDKFNRWTLVEFLASKNGRRFGVCECACGTRRKLQLENVWNGRSKSCGCLKPEANSKAHKTHGFAGANFRHVKSEYRIWALMLQRCKNPNNPAYDRYGGSGISVCERWHKFENFLADMGRRPEGRSLDRVDGRGNYEPGNCRWATDLEQGRNRKNVRRITFNGETLCLSEWAERLGMNRTSLRERLAKWPIEKALTALPRRWPTLQKIG